MEEISKNREELEELFEEKYQNLELGENYKEKLEKYNDDIKGLFEELNEAQIDKADEILSTSNHLSYEECKKCFVLGFKTAINLIFESLKNN